jgi:aspartate/methionine/tyrosine aminotransferase
VRTLRAIRLTTSDEVYRPIFHGDEEWPKSIVELGYPHAVSTCSVSKAYSLAGLRVGWIASTDPNIVKAAALVSAGVEPD